jgi:hypothetical protein
MRIASSPKNRSLGWSLPTNSETPDCLRSTVIRYLEISTTTRDTPNSSKNAPADIVQPSQLWPRRLLGDSFLVGSEDIYPR